MEGAMPAMDGEPDSPFEMSAAGTRSESPVADEESLDNVSVVEESEDTYDGARTFSARPPSVQSTLSSKFEALSMESSERIGNYIIGKTLGEGAFAKVKEAVHAITGTSVAIKILNKNKIRDDYVRRNLQREGQLMRKLRHRHIISLYEILETDKHYCIVTEVATGGEVLDYIVAHGKLPEKEVRKYIRQLVSAVDSMHKSGVVHRDLKAENLLLDDALNLKIIDFGLGNFCEDQAFLSTQCGSPAYTAPEVLGGKTYGPEVDIWSIGINMYAMLTGRLPFNSNNVTTLHALMLDQKYDVPPHLSEGCVDLLSRLLRVRPRERISMEELLRHTWLNEGVPPLSPETAPAPLQAADLDQSLLSHLSRLGFPPTSTAASILERACDAACAVYTMLDAKKRAAVRMPRPIKRSNSENVIMMVPAAAPAKPAVDGEEEELVVSPVRRIGAPRMGSAAKPSSSPVAEGAWAYRRSSIERRPSESRSRPTSTTRQLSTTAPPASIPPAGPVNLARRNSDAFQPVDSGVGTITMLPRTRRMSLSDDPRGARRPMAAGLERPAVGALPHIRLSHSLNESQRPKFAGFSLVTSGKDKDKEDVPSLRYPLNQRMVSEKSAEIVFQDLKTVLQDQEIMFSHAQQPLSVHCVWQDLLFDAEVVKIPRLNMHGVHFRRLKGDAGVYKQLCTQLIELLQL
eukprot:m.34765 g.34765  ORF g.34765 m.34765 type:complete len:686 (-) comp5263_c0_seq1:268-2325(-)